MSPNGSNFGTAVRSGTCHRNGSCLSFLTIDLPPNTTARFIHVNALAYAQSGSSISESEAYGQKYTVSQAAAAEVQFCNYTALSRDMSLVVWR